MELINSLIENNSLTKCEVDGNLYIYGMYPYKITVFSELVDGLYDWNITVCGSDHIVESGYDSEEEIVELIKNVFDVEWNEPY